MVNNHSTFPNKVVIGSSHIFDIVHSDIWGPFSIPNFFGYRNSLTFIDDYSQDTWSFLLIHRSCMLQLKGFFTPRN